MTTRLLGLSLTCLLLGLAALSSCTADDSGPSTGPVPGDAASVARAVSRADLSGKAWLPIAQYVPTRGSLRNPPNTGEVIFHGDGTWSGFDGCNRLSGRFRVVESVLTILSEGGTDMGCANMSPKDGLDGAHIVLSHDATHLTAVNADGDVLVEYRR